MATGITSSFNYDRNQRGMILAQVVGALVAGVTGGVTGATGATGSTTGFVWAIAQASA